MEGLGRRGRGETMDGNNKTIKIETYDKRRDMLFMSVVKKRSFDFDGMSGRVSA